MILVTGGTGLVGSHLLYRLTEKNDTIRAIYRTEAKKEYVKTIFAFYTNDVAKHFAKIEWVKADVTDLPAMIDAFKNITKVYHCAALVSFNPKDYVAMRKTNIYGTAIIANLAIDFKVDKICYISSIATITDATPKKTITEEVEWNDQYKNSEYGITKYGGEMEIWRASQEGVKVAIVNPGVILGSGFYKQGTGKLFTSVYNGLKYYTNGITGFVGVKDVVNAMILLMESPIKNERYILVSENKSFKEILFSIADAFAKKRPNRYLSKTKTTILWRLDWLLTKITRKAPMLTKSSAKSAHNISFYSSEKIKKALNFKFEPIDEVIKTVCKNFTT